MIINFCSGRPPISCFSLNIFRSLMRITQCYCCSPFRSLTNYLINILSLLFLNVHFVIGNHFSRKKLLTFNNSFANYLSCHLARINSVIFPLKLFIWSRPLRAMICIVLSFYVTLTSFLYIYSPSIYLHQTPIYICSPARVIMCFSVCFVHVICRPYLSLRSPCSYENKYRDTKHIKLLLIPLPSDLSYYTLAVIPLNNQYCFFLANFSSLLNIPTSEALVVATPPLLFPQLFLLIYENQTD